MKELVLVPSLPKDMARWQRLPVGELRWLPERRQDCQGPKITQKGYRKGLKPGNFGKVYPADPLTPGEVLALIEACPTGRVGSRNKALIALLWRAGLRISEALALLPHHVDFDGCTVTVMRGKGGKRRTVGIDQGGLEHVKTWLEVREGIGVSASSPLFCTVSKPNPGNLLFAAYVRELFHELGEKAGIPKRVHPHGLRHTLACELAREGVPMHLIQRQLGHSNLGTTATYLQGIAPFEVVDVMAARVWPGQTPVPPPTWAAEEIAPGVARAPETGGEWSI